MSGGRNSSGSAATTGRLPTQKMKGHDSFSSSTQEHMRPGSPGKPYVDGSNIRNAKGKGSGTKGRPDSKGKTPNVQQAPAAGSGKGGWKNNDWS